MIFRLSIVGALSLALGACGQPPEPPRPSLQETPTHARYSAALREFGLDTVALGQAWLTEAERSVREPLAAATPFFEAGYFPPEQPTAVAYQLDLDRGRRLSLELTYEGPERGRLFVDIFEVREGQPASRLGGAEVFSHDPADGPAEPVLVEADVRRGGAHVIRLQPELLRGGTYTIAHRTLAAFAFPLPDRAMGRGASGFGAPRDGGARDHHGVDLFAPRGTPVVAIADGVVSVDETSRGGRVIWLREARLGRNLYYAHLNDWAVQSGDRVRVGDVIGYVGNTGNAITTPPHLHFGVYNRGPTDPQPYLYRDDPELSRRTAPQTALGTWVTVADLARWFRPIDGERTAVPQAGEVRVLAARGQDYRVALPNGIEGLLRADRLEPSTKH